MVATHEQRALLLFLTVKSPQQTTLIPTSKRPGGKGDKKRNKDRYKDVRSNDEDFTHVLASLKNNGSPITEQFRSSSSHV